MELLQDRKLSVGAGVWGQSRGRGGGVARRREAGRQALHQHRNPHCLEALSKCKVSASRQNMHGSIPRTETHGCIERTFSATSLSWVQGLVTSMAFATLVVPPLPMALVNTSALRFSAEK